MNVEEGLIGVPLGRVASILFILDECAIVIFVLVRHGAADRLEKSPAFHFDPLCLLAAFWRSSTRRPEVLPRHSREYPRRRGRSSADRDKLDVECVGATTEALGLRGRVVEERRSEKRQNGGSSLHSVSPSESGSRKDYAGQLASSVSRRS